VVESYQAVTRDDIAALLEKYPMTTNTTVAVGPRKELAGVTVD
jgi:hypothetical protein